MQSNRNVLLKNLLLATSSRNILKYEKDKSKRSKIIAGYIGFSILYLLLVAYCIAITIGYGEVGLTSAIPVMCAIVLGLLEFVFTIFKTNGYLFAFKEYDMLISMPFTIKKVVSSKFLYMYVKNLPWTASISLSMLIGYAYYTHPGILTYIFWIVLSAMLPIIPMVLAAAVGSLIAGIGSGFRHKNIIQTVLSFIFIIFCFSSRYIFESFAKDIATDAYGSLKTVSDTTDRIKSIFLPAKWFEDAIINDNFLSALIFILSTIVIFELFFIIISKFYLRINSRLMTGISRKNYKMHELKTKSVTKAIAYKEFRHFTNSTIYLTNMGLGELFVIILSVAALFVDADSIIATITNNAPLKKEMLLPAVPIVVYFLVGMCSTTTCSFSLEGKNYWIIQSLPISKKTLIQGKMLFNLYLTIPFTILGNLVLGLKFGASIPEILLFILCGIITCMFSTFWGMRCDLKHYKHDWENEVEVIKQGTAIAIYMIPNMLSSMILIAIVVILGFILNRMLVVGVVAAIYAVLALISYRSTMKLCKDNC